MTAIHLPGWKEIIDIQQVPEHEHKRLCTYVAMLILQYLELWQSEMSLRDYLGLHLPEGSALKVMTEWVRRELQDSPADSEDLAARVSAAYEQALLRREWQQEFELAPPAEENFA